MSFKITPSSNRILDPFMVFFIVLGVANIGLRVFHAFSPLGSSQYQSVVCVTLLVAAVSGLAYSVIALRNRLAMSRIDQGLYFFIPLIFAIVGGVTFYIWR